MNAIPVLELIDSFFSYSDEYDHYICEHTAKTSSLGELLEDLETSNITRQRAALNVLISSFLSELASCGPDLLGSETSDYLISSGALPSLLNYAKLKALEARGITDQNLDLEQEIRGVCMVLFLTLVLGRKEEVKAEVVGLSNVFEEVCLAFIKLSLEKPFIPMKKVVLLLYTYLTLILTPHDATQESHLKLTKGMIQQVTQLPPRFQVLATTATEAFYILVVGLLRAMLAACPGSQSQQQGLNVGREWQSPIKYHAEHPDTFLQFKPTWPCTCQDCSDDKHKVESNRHKLILVQYITLILDLLIDRFKLNHTLQLSYLTQQIYDANGVLVMLKFMNQDFSTLPEFTVPSHPHLASCYQQHMIERTLLGMMRMCYSIVKPFPERIEGNMIQYKAPLIMKRLYSKVENEQVQLAALKLIKLQVKYQPKKWKTYPANLRFISAIYQRLPPAKSDWLNGAVDKTDVMTQEEIRQLNIEFNYHNYWQIFDQKVPLPEDDLSEDFKQHYEDWLQEYVWGYYE